MELISLRLRMEDGEYGRVLQEVLRRNYPGFLIQMEEGEGGSGWGIDLTLTDGNPKEGEVLLVDSPGQECLSRESPRLFKYAPAGEMVGKILSLLSEKKGRPIYYRTGEECRLIGCVSSAGGRGVSTLCLAMARELVRLFDKRTLVVSFSPVPDLCFTAGEGTMDVRQFLYRLEKGEAAEDLLDRAVKEDDFGISHFFYPVGRNPWTDLSEEIVMACLGKIAGTGRFQSLVMDLSNLPSSGTMAAARAADRLVFLCAGEGRDERFQKLLRLPLEEGLRGKMIWAKRAVRSMRADVEEFYGEGERKTLLIPFDAFLDGRMEEGPDREIPLDGDYGEAVDGILKAALRTETTC